MNLASDLLSRGDPAAPAICAGSVEFTYGELLKDVERTARVLLARGGRQQDRVALWAENGVFFVIGYLAIIRAGMCAVPLQTDCLPQTAMRIAKEAGIRTILVSTRHQKEVSRWASDANVGMLSEAELAGSAEILNEPLPDIDLDEDLAALMFTSGSTGEPKGVMVTHRNIACNTRDIVNYLRLSSNDRALVVLPFFYCFGLSVLHTHLFAGGSVVINNQFMYPEKVLQELETRACTGLAGVPSTYQILLRQSRFKRSSLPSLRWLQQAGGRLPNPCVQEIAEAFPHVKFYVMYGQTEGTARLSYLPPDRLQDKLGSIGTGLASTELEVLAADGRPVQPGSDEVGEIVASGDNITRGYWNDPTETAKYFRGGKLHTGDLARVDAEGFIYIVEREREMIKAGGNRVSAQEVEDTIASLPHIVEVAVVGASHDLLGEAIVAFVTMTVESGKAVPDVMDHCRRLLPASKTPEAVVHVQRLPHGSSGKVMKAVLRRFADHVLHDSTAESSASDVVGMSLGVVRIERRTPVMAAHAALVPRT
jgi:long-chain acyl-CoA synthetase